LKRETTYSELLVSITNHEKSVEIAKKKNEQLQEKSKILKEKSTILEKQKSSQQDDPVQFPDVKY